MKDKSIHQIDPDIITVAKGAGIIFLGTIFGSLLRYSFQILVARHLGANLFGLFILGLAIFQVAGMIAELGLPNGVIRYVALYLGENDKARLKGIILSALKTAFVSSIVVGLLILLFSKTIVSKFFGTLGLEDILPLFAIAIPFKVMSSVFLSGTQGFKIMKYRVVVRDIFEPIGRIVLILFFSILGYQLFKAVLSYILPISLGTAIAFHYQKKIFPQITQRHLKPIHETKKLLDFSWPLLFAQFLSFVILWVDTFMLGYYKTPYEVGVYNAAQRTAFLGIIIITSFNSIFSPMISDLFNRKEHKKLNQHFKTTAKWIFTINLPIFILVVWYAKPIMSIFGSHFLSGTPCLIILSTGWFVHSSTGSVGQMIYMTGRSKLGLLNISIVFAVNIFLNALLIPKFGMVGAAFATTAAIVLMNVICLVEVKFLLGMHPYSMDFLKSLAAGISSFLVIFLSARLFLTLNSLPELFFVGLTYLGLYCIVLLVLGLSEEDKFILKKFRDRFSFH